MVWKMALILLLSSCAFKKEEEKSEVQSFSLLTQRDLDGISQSEKARLGLNPFVAYFPKLEIEEVKGVSLSFSKNDENKRVSLEDVPAIYSGQQRRQILDERQIIRKKVVQYHLADFYGKSPDKESILNIEDLFTFFVSDWSDDQYSKASVELGDENEIKNNDLGKVGAAFRVRIKNSKLVSSISHLDVKAIFYNKKELKEVEIGKQKLKNGTNNEIFRPSGIDSFGPSTIYDTNFIDLDDSVVFKAISDRDEVALRLSDFKYYIDGQEIIFSDLVSKLKSEFALVVFSTPKETEYYFVSSGINLEAFLKSLNKEVKYDSRFYIEGIDGMGNTATTPLNLENINKTNAMDGFWAISGDGENVKSILRPGGTYIVSYATLSDLIIASRVKNKVVTVNGDQESAVITKQVRDFDDLSIRVKGLVKRGLFRDEKKSVYFDNLETNRGHWCYYTERFLIGEEIEDLSLVGKYKTENIKFELVKSNGNIVWSANPNNLVKDSQILEAYISKLNDGVIRLRFGVVEKGLKLKISIPNDFRSEQVPYGVLGNKCRGRENLYTNIFNINLSVSIFGTKRAGGEDE